MRRVADILRLIRFPFMTTTTGDVLVGVFCTSLILGRGPRLDGPELICLIICSACLYAFGMATNDIFDRERDRKIHPERPLPSGRITVRAAWVVAGVFLVIALGLSNLLGWRTALLALGMILAILSYNGLLKRFTLGAINMGAIRGMNVLLGWSVVAGSSRPGPIDVRPAAAVFGYIALTTLLSTAEEDRSRSRVVLSLVGILGVLGFARWGYLGGWTGCMIPLLLLIAWRLWVAFRDPSPGATGQTVRLLLMGLYFLDAHFILQASHGWAGSIVLALLLPAILLSRALRVSS